MQIYRKFRYVLLFLAILYQGCTTTAPDLIPYRLVPYEQLERLPRSDNLFESMFDSRGIAKDSERVEFLLLFPMGIPEVGSIRQRGHHAIKLVGRAYFDDPELFDKNFEFH